MSELHVDLDLLRTLLHGTSEGGDSGPDSLGVFERALGFGSATGSVKSVHLMNDLAQCLLGGTPAHSADHLCRLIREHKSDEEPTSNEALWEDRGLTGEVVRRALPRELGSARVSELRDAVKAVLNHDKGMYKAGTGMASGLATHRDLLGREGFRRFRIGRYLVSVLGESGAERLRELYLSDRDPVTRFLSPLLVESELNEGVPPRDWAPPPTALDRVLGVRLTALLQHPLSKPTLLRYFSLTLTLGILLRTLGAGRPDARPTVLALTQESPRSPRPARTEARQSYQRGLEALDRGLAAVLAEHPRFSELLGSGGSGAARLSVERRENTLDQAGAVIAAARRAKKAKLYWPDRFAERLALQAGCLWPRDDRAGWGRYLVLTEDQVEAIILMYCPPSSSPLPWRTLWSKVREELGIVIGADSYHDSRALRAAGVVHVDARELTENSDHILSMAIERGVGRVLPDSGAEAGGELQ